MNDFTTCNGDVEAVRTYKYREPPYAEDEDDDGRRAAQMLGVVIVYGLVMLLGAAVSGVCWWIGHR